MNLHPLTALLLLGLAFLFYTSGQYFFFMTTLAIGFLLFVVSFSTPSPSHGDGHKSGGSLYPEEMKIHIGGDEGPPPDGQKELGESIAGSVEFTGKLLGKLFGGSGKKEGGH